MTVETPVQASNAPRQQVRRASILIRRRVSNFQSEVHPGDPIKAGDYLGMNERASPPIALDMRAVLRRKPRILARSVLVKPGDDVQEGMVLARVRPRFLFGATRELRAPVSGTVEAILPDESIIILRAHGTRESVLAEVQGVVLAADKDEVAIQPTGSSLYASAGFGPNLAGRLICIEDLQQLPERMAELEGSSDGTPIVVVARRGASLRDIIQAHDATRHTAIVVPCLRYSDFAAARGQEPTLSLLVVVGFSDRESLIALPTRTWEWLLETEGTGVSVVTEPAAGRPALLRPASTTREEPTGTGAENSVLCFHDLSLEIGSILSGHVAHPVMTVGSMPPATTIQVAMKPNRLVPLSNLMGSVHQSKGDEVE